MEYARALTKEMHQHAGGSLLATGGPRACADRLHHMGGYLKGTRTWTMTCDTLVQLDASLLGSLRPPSRLIPCCLMKQKQLARIR